MRAVAAVDSFKGSLSSLEAGNAVREGILRADPGAEVIVRPLADGGEGTVEALTACMGGTITHAAVTGPLGEKTSAEYGILRDQRTAVMEMSQAAGIGMLQALGFGLPCRRRRAGLPPDPGISQGLRRHADGKRKTPAEGGPLCRSFLSSHFFQIAVSVVSGSRVR